MRRRFLNLIAAVSLLLCLATVGVWVRSYWVTDRLVRIQQRGFDYRIESCGGGIAWLEFDWRGIDRSFLDAPEFGVWNYVTEEPMPSLSSRLRDDAGTSWRGLNFGGFAAGRGGGSEPFESSRLVAVPYWSVCLLFGALGSFVARRCFRRGAKPGHCARCGYDLRAGHERCPECGKAVAM